MEKLIIGIVGVVLGALAATVFFNSQLLKANSEKDKFTKYFGDCLMNDINKNQNNSSQGNIRIVPVLPREQNTTCFTFGGMTNCRTE
jgi:hypothetical protein